MTLLLLHQSRLSACHGSIPGADLGGNCRAGKPRGGHILGFRIEKKTVASHAVKVAEERQLVAGKSEDGQRNRYADVDAHHAAVRAPDKLARIVAALGVDHRAVGKTVVVHQLEAFFEAVDALDAQHRAKDLLAATGHLFGHMVKDRGADIGSLLASRRKLRIAPVKNQLGAFFDRRLNPAKNKILVALIDDRTRSEEHTSE